MSEIQNGIDDLAPESAPIVAPAEEPKDLGFGSIVGGADERRLIERDGRFTARRDGFPALSYLNGYHSMLSMSWPKFLGIVTVAYVALNAMFASAYLFTDGLRGMTDESMGGHFMRAFFFSVETFATIGYGNIYPVGSVANWLVTLEAWLGILSVALLTGIVFARFARPTAAVMFSDMAVVAPYQGKTAFMFRITNARSNQLMELEAKVLYTRLDGFGRQYTQLKLERTKVVFFPLTWTIVHPIDETSPLWGKSYEDLIDNEAEFLILMSGVDETFAQMVHARSSYKADEIVYGKKFVSVYKPLGADGIVTIDISKLSTTEEAPLDDQGMYGNTSTFRHTGHFTGFVPPREGGTKRR